MRYVIYGAGAIGGIIAARLARARKRVAVVARGDHLDAIRAGGLRFESPNESFDVPVDAVAHPGELDWQPNDVVLLCMKTQDSEAALLALRDAAGSSVAVVCAQNGVANERMALRRFDDVYAMVVMLPATHLEPGLVVAQSKAAPGILDLGRYPRGVDARAERIAADLESATFSARPDARVMRFKYAKLLMNPLREPLRPLLDIAWSYRTSSPKRGLFFLSAIAVLGCFLGVCMLLVEAVGRRERAG